MGHHGAISFSYAQDWLAWEYAVPISLSLPLREQTHPGESVVACLENLLPESHEIRYRVAAKLRANGTGAYHLLQKLGRDCVGALQFVVDGDDADSGKPGENHADPMTEAEIADMLGNLTTSPLGIVADAEFRISIAGFQEKTVLLRPNGKWFRPRGILKGWLNPAGFNTRQEYQHCPERDCPGSS